MDLTPTYHLDYKKSKAPKNTMTRNMNELTSRVGNVYETVVILGKRSNQISQTLKRELDSKLQDFSTPQDFGGEEAYENREQIEIARSYETMPKPTLIATQELIDDQIVYTENNRDEQLR